MLMDHYLYAVERVMQMQMQAGPRLLYKLVELGNNIMMNAAKWSLYNPFEAVKI